MSWSQGCTKTSELGHMVLSKDRAIKAPDFLMWCHNFISILDNEWIQGPHKILKNHVFTSFPTMVNKASKLRAFVANHAYHIQKKCVSLVGIVIGNGSRLSNGKMGFAFHRCFLRRLQQRPASLLEWQYSTVEGESKSSPSTLDCIWQYWPRISSMKFQRNTW